MTKIGKSDDRVRVARDTGVTLKKAAGDDDHLQDDLGLDSMDFLNLTRRWTAA